MDSAARNGRAAVAGAHRPRLWQAGLARPRACAAATATAALALTAVMTMGTAAAASAIGSGSFRAGDGTAAGQRVTTSQANASVDKLVLRPMPVGTVKFGRGSHRRLTLHLVMYGLTPGSSHQGVT